MGTITKCIACTENVIGQQVNLHGFVAKTRNLGGMVFIDLRDRSGIVQLIIQPEHKQYELAQSLRNEYVIAVSGTIVERGAKNPQMVTGAVEIAVDTLDVISEAETTPLIIADQTDALEEVRFTYRYLDLRRPNMQARLFTRHRLNKIIHQYLDAKEFIEVETPFLSKSTPEGARDYLVPSRIHDGEFYALPQSPQLYKQLLMLAGLEKYYQIVRCFRDEDLRTDRQPEFTQLDIEQAFIDETDIYDLIEGLLHEVFQKIKGIEIPLPFPRMSYEEAMERYGSDKPDVRFDMELIDVTSTAHTTDFSVFNKAEAVKAIVVNGGAKLSRKELDGLTDFVKIYKAKGLAWMKVVNNELEGPIAKFFTTAQKQALLAEANAPNESIILFVADTKDIVRNALGQLRLHIAKKLALIPEDVYKFLWITDWPLLEYDATAARFSAAHHPFTAPKIGQEDMIKTAPESVQARAYDIVLNGYEIGGGSIRIHNPAHQKQMLETIGMDEATITEQFGFLLEAYSYGAPIHGGIALGIDRLTMILTNTDLISDVIAFPKTLSARDLMMQSPSRVSEPQLDDLHIRLKK